RLRWSSRQRGRDHLRFRDGSQEGFGFSDRPFSHGRNNSLQRAARQRSGSAMAYRRGVEDSDAVTRSGFK
ncbi:hypothetical protein A2U01_0093698, partial [Trifolium medium]|nr:hypothetical protein [Trifolium medium]